MVGEGYEDGDKLEGIVEDVVWSVCRVIFFNNVS